MMPCHWFALIVACGLTLSSVQVTRTSWLTPTGFGAALTCIKAVHCVILAAFVGEVFAMAMNAEEANSKMITKAGIFLILNSIIHLSPKIHALVIHPISFIKF
jgi:hypothetical protein